MVIGIGHNSGLTSFDDSVITEFEERLSFALMNVDKWEKTAVTEKNAPKLKTDIEQVRSAYIDIEDARKAAKKPFLDEAKRVDLCFNGPKGDIEKAAKTLKRIMSEFLRAQELVEQNRRDEKAREAREAAEKARKEAEAKHAEVEAKNRKMRADEAAKIIEQKRRAEALEKEAAKAERETEKDVRPSVSGGGRSMAMRTKLVVELADYETAFFEFCEDDRIRDLLVQLASARARTKGFDREKGIPGFTIREEKVL